MVNNKTDKKNHVKNEKYIKREELLDMRQIIYSKLKQGIYVNTILRTFKHKVEQYLEKYRTSLSYYQEKTWRDKIVITEKAVKRQKQKFRTNYEVTAKQEDRKDAVKEMFDAARKQELVIESLPDPPQDDLEKRLSKLKKFNRRLLDDKKVKIAECEAEVVENGVPKVVTKRVQVAENKTEVIDNNIDKPEVLYGKEHEENYADKKLIEDETLEDNSDEIEVEDEASVQVLENALKVMNESLDKTNSNNETGNSVNVVHDECEDAAHEFNAWYLRKLNKRKCSKVIGKAATKVFAKVDAENHSETEWDLNQDYMCKKQSGLGGVGFDGDTFKGMSALMFVPLFQAILAIMLFCVKTLQEQSVPNARLSDLPQPSLSTPFQPMASSSSLHCSCLTKSRMCCKVTTAITGRMSSLARIASTGMGWYRQVCGVVKCMKESLLLSVNGAIMSADLVERLAVKVKQRNT